MVLPRFYFPLESLIFSHRITIIIVNFSDAKFSFQMWIDGLSYSRRAKRHRGGERAKGKAWEGFDVDFVQSVIIV